MRHLVICCDGTWNRADQDRDGVPTPTNVRLFHNLLASSAEDGQPQVAHYFSGVGADGSKVSRLFDGGTGHGLSRNIMNAYLWLSRTYQEGDLISVIGFSRGAYTVRSLVAMVTSCGLARVPEPGTKVGQSWRTVSQVFEQGYVPKRRSKDWSEGLEFFPEFQPPRDEDERIALGNRIEFLGVWDTVGALGVPDALGFLDLFDSHETYAFHDTHLNPGVRCARHAVALDERRGPFAPTLWTTPTGEILEEPPQVRQLWFPGVHSDVGGGYREHGLSDGALRWMVDEAEDHTALRFTRQLADIKPDPTDVLHDSCVGAYTWLNPVPRNVPRVSDDAKQVHSSAVARHRNPPVRQDAYRRGKDVEVTKRRTVTVPAHEPWSESGLYLQRGTYRMSAIGEWLDKDAGADPNGVDDPAFLARIGYRMRDLTDDLEQMWRGVSGNAVAEMPFSKRVGNARWMQLIAAIANGGYDDVGRPLPLQVEPIGRGPVEITIKEPGYLYAFANDAWGMYSNNRGSVDLTVERIA